MALVTALVMVVVGGLLGGCGSDDDPAGGAGAGPPHADPAIVEGGEPADPEPEVAAPDASFDAAVTVDGDTVTVTYRIRNDGDEPLLLVNQVPDRGSSGALSASRAYVVGRSGGLVQVAQRLFPRPDTDRMTWESDPDVGLTRLRPGRTFEGEVEAPLERYSPWGDDLGYGTIALPDPVEEVEFCLGVLAEPDPSRILEEDDGVLMTTHGDTTDQYLFCVGPAT